MQRKLSPWNHNLSQHELLSCYKENNNAAYPKEIINVVIVKGKTFPYPYDPPSVGVMGGGYDYAPKIIVHGVPTKGLEFLGPTIFPSLLCSCLGRSHAMLPVGAGNITGLQLEQLRRRLHIS